MSAEHVDYGSNKVLAPLEQQQLGLLGLSHTYEQAHDSKSLLPELGFNSELIEQIDAIVSEAIADSRVRKVNSAVWQLTEGVDHAKQSFGWELLTHQRDVAEIMVGMGICMKFTKPEIKVFALAGLTHDAAKGDEGLLDIFMKQDKWGPGERRRNESHPALSAELQKSANLGILTQYLTEGHHLDLLRNPQRGVDGGYGQRTIMPPAGEADRWREMAHLFSASDYIAANMRARVYKTERMTATEAIDHLPDDLDTPQEIVDRFREQLQASKAA